MTPTEPQRTTASSTLEQWSAYLEDLHARIAHRFRRPEVRERLRRYLLGLIGDTRRKNGWQIAEAIGETRPRGTQRLLNGARWDADAVRDDLRGYVVEHLGDEESGVLVLVAGAAAATFLHGADRPLVIYEICFASVTWRASH